MTAFNSFAGNFREDGFGRVVVDTCPSDEEHLRSSKTDPATNRPQCRRLVEEVFAKYLGKSGRLHIEATFYEDYPGVKFGVEVA